MCARMSYSESSVFIARGGEKAMLALSLSSSLSSWKFYI
jgi:hypothetical protein